MGFPQQCAAVGVLALLVACATSSAPARQEPAGGGSTAQDPDPGIEIGATCDPTPEAARGSATAGYHCDDLTAPDRPVWREGRPALAWFDVTVVGGERAARPDDTGCDEAGIQLAVDAACAAGGGVVYAPPGTYRVCRGAGAERAADWGVEVGCSGVHLRGAGIASTRFVGEPSVRATNARTMFRFIDGDRVSMSRCTIDGSYDGERAGWGNGIRALGVRDSTFCDMRIVDHFNHNISLKPSTRSSDDNRVVRLVTERGRQTNIIVYSAAAAHGATKNQRNKIIDCTATGAQVHFGLEVRYSDDTEIVGGLFAQNKNGGINVEESAFRTKIVGTVMRDNGGSGLAIWGNRVGSGIRPARIV